MSPTFKLALSVSAGLHAAAFIGLPITDPAAFDVERGPTSVELYLINPDSPRPRPVQPTTPPPEPSPQHDPVAQEERPPMPETVVSEERTGAITELLPNYLRNPPPVYPALARERGHEGTILLEVEVLPSGRCGAITILSASGYALLDEAAVAAVRAWVFKPARRGQQPVAFRVEIPITFRLTDSSGSVAP